LAERTKFANQIYWQYCSKYGKANVVAIYVSIHFNALDGTFEGSNPSGFSVHIYKGQKGKESGKLAQCIIDELKGGTKQINRGVVEQDLYITRETVMPAALSENGFMDNEVEANLMINPSFQKEVAVEHAMGICKYFGIPYVAEQPVQAVQGAFSGQYTIQSGDNFWKLETNNKWAVGTLQKLNPGVNPSRLQVGQKINIPGSVNAAPEQQKPTPKPAAKKEYVYFPPNCGTWSVYPLNKQPIKANAIGAINPTKFGGLEYQVLGKPFPNIVTIKTSNWGNVNIFVGDSNSKVYMK
jgi:LysM repeat protein